MGGASEMASPMTTKDGASHILIHDDARAGRAVQQSLQVKARELIIRPLADMRRKCGECRRIARFEFRKRIQVATRCRIVVLLARQRLESANASVLPRSIRSPTGRPQNTLAASCALIQIRVPSCLLAVSNRAATLIVSP